MGRRKRPTRVVSCARRDLQRLAVQAGQPRLGTRPQGAELVHRERSGRPGRDARRGTAPGRRRGSGRGPRWPASPGAVTASTVPAIATSAVRSTTSSRRRSTVAGSRLTAGDGSSAPAGASGSGGLTTDIGARAGSAALARMLPPGAACRRAPSLDCSLARATAM